MLPRDQALHGLRDLIAQGRWPAGEQLPGEQELARRLGVARGTIRWALAQLQNDGLLVRDRRGLRTLTAVPQVFSVHGVILLSASLRGWPDERHDMSGGHAIVACDHAAAALLAERGHLLRVVNLEEVDLEDPRTILAQASALAIGLSVTPADPRLHRMLELAKARRLPCAMAGAGPQTALHDRVNHDHANGARQLVDWLIETRGRRSIIEVGTPPSDWWWINQRHRGYARGMTDHGLRPRNRLQLNIMTIEQASLADRIRQTAGFLLELLRGPEKPDALMVSCDFEIAIIAGALRLCGQEPNRDIDLVGYDGNWDNHQFAEVPIAPLATIDQEWPALGRHLAGQIISRLTTSAPPTVCDDWLPGRLIITPDQAHM